MISSSVKMRAAATAAANGYLKISGNSLLLPLPHMYFHWASFHATLPTYKNDEADHYLPNFSKPIIVVLENPIV